MAEIASESWWIKLGVMYDKSGFKAAIGGMLDLKRAVGGLADTYKQIVDSSSALYNNARYLGVSTNQLQIWERTFRRIGGSAQEAQENINNLNFIASKLRLGEGGEKATIAARLGLAPSDLLNYETAMKSLNRTFNENFGQSNYKVFRELAQQLGLSQYAIKLVTMSMSDYDKTIKETQDIGLIPEHQLKAAESLREQFQTMAITWENFKSSIVSATFPALNELITNLRRVLGDPNVQKSISNLIKLFEARLNELVSSDNVTKFFDQLAEGVRKITSDDSINKFIETMSLLIKGIDYGIIKPIGIAGKGYGALLSEAGNIKGEMETGGIDWKSRLAPINNLIESASSAGVAKSVVNYFTGAITINGVRNAEDVPGALQDASGNSVATQQQIQNVDASKNL